MRREDGESLVGGVLDMVNRSQGSHGNRGIGLVGVVVDDRMIGNRLRLGVGDVVVVRDRMVGVLGEVGLDVVNLGRLLVRLDRLLVLVRNLLVGEVASKVVVGRDCRDEDNQ